ncbi:uncharacterized protein TrAtP1_008479 [Trichoderma atroviride]|uniref:uncharacterized protein n=1 Tax=Hypocrea atroviridis TaxID=63577 RepID=UPI003325E418|nr:hypothetical protein TrAtP1_008479 [Trichoderma atroviride]
MGTRAVLMSKDAAAVESGTELQQFWAPIGSQSVAPSFNAKATQSAMPVREKKKLRRGKRGPLGLSARDPIHSMAFCNTHPPSKAAKLLVSKFANSRLATHLFVR